MDWRYDDKANAAYLRLSERPIQESDEVLPGAILDYEGGS